MVALTAEIAGSTEESGMLQSFVKVESREIVLKVEVEVDVSRAGSKGEMANKHKLSAGRRDDVSRESRLPPRAVTWPCGMCKSLNSKNRLFCTLVVDLVLAQSYFNLLLHARVRKAA